MIIRPIISVPLPWLTILFARFYPQASLKNRERKPFKTFWPRSLKVTKLGKWYISILLLIGVAAINTGNNLLYLVVGMLLSLIIISGIMSESTLRGIKVKRGLPRRIFADMNVTSTLEITNTKRALPSFSFSLSELSSTSMESTTSYVLKLSHGESVTRHSTYLFTSRGEIYLSGLLISTSFPFSLFNKGKREEAGLTRIIYPRIWPLKDIDGLGSTESTHENKKRSIKGEGIELHSLRDYSPGDDARKIDWKSSARALVLLTKEFERDQEQRLMIDFDNTGSNDAHFEECVSKAASLAWHLYERGFYVGLKTRERTIECARSREHIFSLLDHLALIEPDPADPADPAASVRASVSVRAAGGAGGADTSPDIRRSPL